MENDIKGFCLSCLHCHVNDHRVISHAFLQAAHGRDKNEVLHFDFISMHQLTPKSRHLFKYVLILKDEFSGFLELISTTSPDHFTVTDSLMDWYQGFGVPKTLVSDQGSHFADKTPRSSAAFCKSNTTSSLVYTPSANGTVEIVCPQVQSAMKSLLSDFRMQGEDCPSFLPVLQSILNHSKCSHREGYALITIMTGLAAPIRLQAAFHQNSDSTKTTEATLEELTSHCKNLQSDLEKIHNKVWEGISTNRDAKWKRMSGKAARSNFSV